MCRWAAYIGSPIFLEDVISLPGHSLVRQSHGATRCHTPVNADGFGMAWYGERAEPGLYRDIMPAWSDSNLKSLTATLKSHLFLAHVRASTGTATSRNNCHPFAVGRWSFMHNGQFGGYDRTCRNLAPEVIEEHLKNGDPYVIRQKMPLTGETTFFDVLHGNITIKNEELEDQVLLKRDGMPTYNFANVIDDHLMHITHIMRGAEFITSTPKYILLYESFGWDVPTFIHLAPVMGKNEDGSISKLSKRHGATSFDDLVKAGYLPDAIVNYVALLGWNPKTTNQEIFSMAELIEHFSLEGLSKSPAVFDYDKLGWINGEYLKAMSDEDFAKMARPFAGDLPDYLEKNWAHLAALLKTRIQRLGDLPQEIAFLCEQPAFDAELHVNKRNKVTPEKAAELLPGMMALLEAVPESDWNNDALYEKLNAYIEEQGIKKGLAMWVLRIAAAGQKVTPGGATEILSLLGKKISMERIKKSLAKLQEL